MRGLCAYSQFSLTCFPSGLHPNPKPEVPLTLGPMTAFSALEPFRSPPAFGRQTQSHVASLSFLVPCAFEYRLAVLRPCLFHCVHANTAYGSALCTFGSGQLIGGKCVAGCCVQLSDIGTQNSITSVLEPHSDGEFTLSGRYCRSFVPLVLWKPVSLSGVNPCSHLKLSLRTLSAVDALVVPACVFSIHHTPQAAESSLIADW